MRYDNGGDVVRADWALELQLQQTAQQVENEEVRAALDEVLAHLASGRPGHRRGGERLLRLLEIARLRAGEESEWDTLRLVHDAIDYATGRALKPEFEERFRLFQDGRRSETNRHFLAGVFHAMSVFVQDRGKELLDEQPDLTATALLGRLAASAADGHHVEAPPSTPGRYRIVRGRAETARWLERVMRDRLDFVDPSSEADRLSRSDFVDLVTHGDDDANLVLRAAELRRQEKSLAELRALVDDPRATELALQKGVESNCWVFGGRYSSRLARRRLVPGSEIDVPLVRSDGSLHVVELKRALGVPAIVKGHRGRLVPTHEVHDAVSQAVNYLIVLDEHRDEIKEELGVDVRRASATVLVGHPACHPDIAEKEIEEVFRILSGNLSRIEVRTYKELLDSAARSLDPTSP